MLNTSILHIDLKNRLGFKPINCKKATEKTTPNGINLTREYKTITIHGQIQPAKPEVIKNNPLYAEGRLLILIIQTRTRPSRALTAEEKLKIRDIVITPNGEFSIIEVKDADLSSGYMKYYATSSIEKKTSNSFVNEI